MHADDIGRSTKSVEIQLSGRDPMILAPDLLILPVPAHTKGHTVLIYQEEFLCNGDHLAWSERWGHLVAFRNACWYSWAELLKSMRRLAEYSFAWVLPGHGRRYHADVETLQQQMQQCIEWMSGQ